MSVGQKKKRMKMEYEPIYVRFSSLEANTCPMKKN